MVSFVVDTSVAITWLLHDGKRRFPEFSRPPSRKLRSWGQFLFRTSHLLTEYLDQGWKP